MKRIIVASTNEGKIKEIKEMLQDVNIEAVGLNEVFENPIDIVEDGKTFIDNALIKAHAISDMLGVPVLSDDSGIEVDALDKQPGVHSARFLGYDTSYDIKNQHIIDAIKGKERTARYVCAMALVIPGSDPIVIQETMEGQIHNCMEGNNGFGYDPIFFYPPCNKTAAMMTNEEKNTYSHRAKALKKLVEKIKETI